jgi:ATP-dependent RNA helicase RhlB
MLKKLIKNIGKNLRILTEKSDKKTAQHTAEEPVSSKPELPSSSVLSAAEGADLPAKPKKRRRRRSRKKNPATPSSSEPLPLPESNWDLSAFEITPAAGKTRFHDFQLPLPVMHAIADLHYEYCTPIQEKTLPEGLQGRDIVGRAQTGTGKTAAFLITIFSRMLAELQEGERLTGHPLALILAPTRELVVQIGKDAEALAKYTPFTSLSVFGGASYQQQMDTLNHEQIDVLVATPGRLLDFLRKQVVQLDRVRFLVIDEADRMLDMGFIPDVRRLVLSTPPKEKRQTMLFSATISSEVRHLASQWCKKPVTIDIEPEQVAVESVDQVVYLATTEEKFVIVYNLLTKRNLDRVMIFTNRRDEARRLAERLTRHGITCAMLSGEVPQNKRQSRLENFRDGKIKVLVATDVAGRGIHIEGVSHVINYTLPHEPEDYVHRIGRTGRAGSAGISVSFACEEGAFYLPPIEEFLGRKLECIQPEAELLEPLPEPSVKPVRRTTKKPAPRSRRRPRRY